jgi:hypothetical protein
MGSRATFPCLIAMWESIVCPKDPHVVWHVQDCVFRDYEYCGVDNLPIFLVEKEGAFFALISWKHFSMEKIMTRTGKEKKKLKLIYKSTTSDELVQYLKPKLQYFVYHNFVAISQDQQFKNYLESFQNDIIISIINFVENYSFWIQNEMQSMQWHNYQVTILVQIPWMRNPNPNLDDEDSKTIMKYHFYLYVDKTHANAFVQHCLLLHW